MSPKRVLAVAAAVTVTLCAALAVAPPGGVADFWRERRLSASGDSPEAAAQAFLKALAKRDESAIAGLAVTKEEFATHVWPHLPASRPGTNLTLDYVWNGLAVRSRSGLVETLVRFGGRRFQLLGLRFEGKSSDYGAATVHRDARLKVRDETGRESELNLFGSVLELDGEWKIFSFVH